MEKALERVAEQILSFDEASMSSLREKYRSKVEHFDGTKNWERSVIIYCIINAVSLKNTLFNENLLKREGKKEGKPSKGPSWPKKGKLIHRMHIVQDHGALPTLMVPIS